MVPSSLQFLHQCQHNSMEVAPSNQIQWVVFAYE